MGSVGAVVFDILAKSISLLSSPDFMEVQYLIAGVCHTDIGRWLQRLFTSAEEVTFSPASLYSQQDYAKSTEAVFTVYFLLNFAFISLRSGVWCLTLALVEVCTV